MLRWPIPLILMSGCAAAVAPPTRQTVVLTGSAYQRGLQHGEQLGDEVRSFYTRMLSTSILPNLQREQPALSAVLSVYAAPPYADGGFSLQLLTDSAKSLEHSIPRPYRDEMQGIADGAGVPYEQVLLVNTFLDSVLALRSVAQVAGQAQAPVLVRVQIPGIDRDGLDNDGDGVVDNPEEADFPYASSSTATRVELRPDAGVIFTLAAPHGVDPGSIRMFVGGTLLAPDDPQLSITPVAGDATRLTVSFVPAGDWPPGPLALRLSAGDLSLVTDPLPVHAHQMREERLTFTGLGDGAPPWAVPNREATFSAGHPTSFAVASGGVLAHQFALLDASAAHQHTVLFVHQPDTGGSFAVVGWAGMVSGMSGMNAAGLAVACNPSDSLDNSMVRGLLGQVADLTTARLLASGEPIGILQRAVLEGDHTVDAAVVRARASAATYGWTCLFADASGAARAVELTSDPVSTQAEVDFAPGAIDPHGQWLAGTGPTDLVIGSHAVANLNDFPTATVAGIALGPQRSWSTMFFRSLDTVARVRDLLTEGPLTQATAQTLLADPTLVDPTDSMNAVVYAPASGTLLQAMGTEPATASPFQPFAFGASP